MLGVVGGVEEGVRRLVDMGEGLGRVFVIGGAEIYKLALETGLCDRVLWTRVGGEWVCDCFFPGGVLDGNGGGWVRRERGVLEEWVGEEGVGGLRGEGGVEFEVFMVEKVGFTGGGGGE